MTGHLPILNHFGTFLASPLPVPEATVFGLLPPPPALALAVGWDFVLGWSDVGERDAESLQ